MSQPPFPVMELVPEEGPGYVMKWRVFAETEDYASASYTFHVNPNAMTSPYPERSVTANRSTAPDGQWLLTEGDVSPTPWSFSGSILTREQYIAMEFWFSTKEYTRLHLYDHLGRRLVIVPLSFTPEPKRSIGKYWRFTYTVEALVLDIDPVVQPADMTT